MPRASRRFPFAIAAPAGARVAVCTLGFFVALAWVGSAAAAGGTSIANAPTVSSGVQQSENTSTDSTVLGSHGSQNTGCWVDYEYWRLPLTAGDHVTISGDLEGASTNFEVGVFGPGTTDANIGAATAVVSGFPNAGHSLTFAAGATGTYVLLSGPNCYDGNDGPFEFTAKVVPGAVPVTQPVVVLPSIAHVSTAGSLVASVHTPAGAAITDPHLVLQLYGAWKSGASGATSEHVLATATPAHGTARFAFHLPSSLAGTTIEFHVVAKASAGYKAASSPVATTKVA